ncbi:prenyltransferase [Pleomorphochaeta sp. DL1XJH-081]|uniref:prenyltransferase n=1 Tax=Pleomorphochaeta sp. DL1XJH-081 TaxID=3409690 RepID=UPI003BB7464D
MTITQFNRIVEIRTKIISMGTFLCGSLYAAMVTGEWSWSRFLVMAFAVLFVDMGTTGFNSYFDFTSGTDKAELNFERDKVLVHEGVDPQLALLISLALFGAAAVLGLILAWWTSFYLIVVGGICMGVGFVYTGGPYPISRTPFGELFAGGFLGTVLFGISYYVQSLSVDWHSIIVSLPLLILIGMILTVNNTCDREADTVAGRKTLSIVLSERTIGNLMRSMVLVSFFFPMALAMVNFLPMVTIPCMLIAFIPAWKTLLHMEKRGFSLKTKGPSMGSVSQIFLFYCVAFLASMVGALVM